MGKKSLIILCVLPWLVTLTCLGYFMWREWEPKQVLLDHKKATLCDGGRFSLTYCGTNRSKSSNEKIETEVAIIEMQSVRDIGVLDEEGFGFEKIPSEATLNLKLGQYVRFVTDHVWYKLALLELKESQVVVGIWNIEQPTDAYPR